MHYYVSIPTLDHKVFKYAGYRSNDAGALDWYVKNGIIESDITEGPYHVLATTEYLGDRVDEDLEPYGEPLDFVPKQYVITVKRGVTVVCDMHVSRSHPGGDTTCSIRAMRPGYMLHVFPVGKQDAVTEAIAWHIEIEQHRANLSGDNHET